MIVAFTAPLVQDDIAGGLRTSQPSIEALKKIAQTLRVTTDSLVFEEDEREVDADLTLQFQAIASMPKKQQSVIKQLL